VAPGQRASVSHKQLGGVDIEPQEAEDRAYQREAETRNVDLVLHQRNSTVGGEGSG
jgi:hypothetical protein